MNTSMNLLLWTTHVTDEHTPLLRKLKKTGFDGVEFPVFAGDAAHYARLGDTLRSIGLRSTTVTVMSAAADPISPSASVRKAALNHLKWAIDMTAQAGGELLIGPLHSALGVFSGKAPTDAERKRSADVLRAAGDHAAKRNIKLGVEYLNRFETYLLTTAEQCREHVDRIDHPAVGMMWDTFHANIEEKNVTQAIKTGGRKIIHVHISESDRGTPGTGMVHWDETFKALKAIKYDGWLTIEAFGRALPDLAAATKVWRDLFPSPENVYQDGLKFMKKQWGR